MFQEKINIYNMGIAAAKESFKDFFDDEVFDKLILKTHNIAGFTVLLAEDNPFRFVEEGHLYMTKEGRVVFVLGYDEEKNEVIFCKAHDQETFNEDLFVFLLNHHVIIQ